MFKFGIKSNHIDFFRLLQNNLNPIKQEVEISNQFKTLDCKNQNMPLLDLKMFCVAGLISIKGTFSESLFVETKSDLLMVQ
jgi:hypothetical protein